jgi:hypothetical protein
MEPRGASDIDGQTERSIWAGAHKSKREQRPLPGYGLSTSRVWGAVTAATWFRRLAETNFEDCGC